MNHFLKTILDLIFPQPETIQRIEKMSPEDFALQAARPLENPPENIHSLFNYKHPLVRQALWELKYRGNMRIAEIFAYLLYEEIIQELSDEALFSAFIDPIMMPLPLSVQRLKERGWNQSEMIVQALYSLDKNKTFTINLNNLIKIRHTKPQTSLTRSERLRNLSGCFNVKNPSLIKQRNIILIDDVTTTGSTIQEAMNTLKAAGAQHILAFTIGH